MSVRRLAWLLPLAFTLFGCDAPLEQESSNAIRPVKLFTVSNESSEQTHRYPAVIAASKEAELSFQVSGLLQELNIKTAQEIKQGDVLAKLDQRDFSNQLASAKAEYENAEREYQRLAKVADKGLISQSDLTKQRSARDIAKAQLGIAEKALSDSVLTSPFDAMVAQVPVTRLQSITAGQAITTIIATDELEVTFDVPSRLIRSDQEPLVELILNNDPSVRLPTTFKELELIADLSSQTYPITMVFTPPEDKIILPGMLATIEVTPLPGEQSLLQVPLAAIQSQGDQRFVWLFDPQSNTVSRRDVVVKDGIGNQLSVESGLNSGDVIVAAGGAYLSEGLEVRPWQE